jgi:hypothetical protein
MADKVEYSRLILKRSNTPGVVPTIPPGGAGLSTMTATDTFVGELFANVQDDSVWIRTNNGQIPLLLNGTSFTGNTSGTCIQDLYVHNFYGCSPIQLHNNFTFREDVDTPGQGVRMTSFSGNSFIGLDKAYTNEQIEMETHNPTSPTTFSKFTIEDTGVYGIHQTLGTQDMAVQFDDVAIVLDKSNLSSNKISYISVQDTQQQLIVQDNLLADTSTINLTQTQSQIQNTDGNDVATYTGDKTSINLNVNDTIDTSMLDINKNRFYFDIDNIGGWGRRGQFVLDPANQFSATGTFLSITDTNTAEQTIHQYQPTFTKFITELPANWEIMDRSEYDGVGEIVKELKTSNTIPSQAYIKVTSKTSSANSFIDIVADDTIIIQSNNSGSAIGMTGPGLTLDCGVGLNYTLQNLPAFQDDAAAGIGGLTTGMLYQTTGAGAAPLNAAGILMVKQ